MDFFFSKKASGEQVDGVTTLPDGRRYSDPDYLIRTKEAEQHFREIKNLSGETPSGGEERDSVTPGPAAVR